MTPLPAILLVADSGKNLVYLGNVIGNLKNVTVIQASSGKEALVKSRGIELALAVIDVDASGMEGYELAKKINRAGSSRQVPVVFLVGEPLERTFLRECGSMMFDCLIKPVDEVVLAIKINLYVNLFIEKQVLQRKAARLGRRTAALKRERGDGLPGDITQRTALEESLRTHQIELVMQNEELMAARTKALNAAEKYTELYDFAPSGYFTLSAEKAIQELNHSGARILGLERSYLIGSHFDFFVSKETQPVFTIFFQNVFTRNEKQVCEVMLQTVGHKVKYVHLEGVVSGNGRQCLINVADITDRKLAEEAISVSEEKYKTMLNASPDGIVLIDPKKNIVEVSEVGVELFGLDNRDDLVGKNFLRFVSPDEKNRIRILIRKTLHDKLVQNVEIKIKKKNNLLFLSEISSILIHSPNGEPKFFMIIVRDISQRKKMEAQQIHADRMANLGEMASGIAHEINQPLNIISMVTDKILFEAARADAISMEFLEKKTEKIFENISRMRNIIDHIRAFSRSHDDYLSTAFSINSSIANAISMVSEQFKHLGIVLDFQPGENLPQIFGNTYKFEQVILNLLSNARDAVIEKKSKHPAPYAMEVAITSFIENQCILVEVSDNGTGINHADFNIIMLPFYTTKAEGKGTGLGLSICYQIIKEMGGNIEIMSDGMNGTKIKLVLNVQNKK